MEGVDARAWLGRQGRAEPVRETSPRWRPDSVAMCVRGGVSMGFGHARSMQVPTAVPAGALATLVMDGAMVAAGYIGGPALSSDRLNVDVVGRWSGGLMRGQYRHRDITSEPARRGELVLGLSAHYAMGIALTEVFLRASRRGGGRPSLPAATGFGIATAVLPLMVMFPSMGYGWFALRSGEAARINRVMLIGHTAFGVGIGLGSTCFSKPSRSASGSGCGRPASRGRAGARDPRGASAPF